MKNYWKDKKVLVTGAAGFIGSHAVDVLVKKGAKVTAVVSPNTKKNKINSNLKLSLKNIKLVEIDLLDVEKCILICRNQEIILNFAAIDGGKLFKINNSAEILRINTQIVLNLLEAAKINKVDKILLMSSIEVYPIKEQHLIEKTPIVIDKEDNGYIWSKYILEIVAKKYADQYGLKIAIARVGNTYGPRDYYEDEKGRVVPRFICQAIKNNDITIWGTGNQKLSFIYVLDLVEALLNLTEKYAVCDPVNIVGSFRVTIKQLAKQIIKICKSKSKIKFEKVEEVKMKNRIVNILKAQKVINFSENITLVQGLVKTIDYLKS